MQTGRSCTPTLASAHIDPTSPLRPQLISKASVLSWMHVNPKPAQASWLFDASLLCCWQPRHLGLRPNHSLSSQPRAAVQPKEEYTKPSGTERSPSKKELNKYSLRQMSSALEEENPPPPPKHKKNKQRNNRNLKALGRRVSDEDQLVAGAEERDPCSKRVL